MPNLAVSFVPIRPSAKLPAFQTPGSAGADLFAFLMEGQIEIPKGEVRMISTGLRCNLPEGYMGLVLSRSGLAYKHRVFVINAPGLIDSDYRGELSVLLMNGGNRSFFVNPYDRIAQFVLQPTVGVQYFVGKTLMPSTRVGGFGSTGV